MRGDTGYDSSQVARVRDRSLRSAGRPGVP